MRSVLFRFGLICSLLAMQPANSTEPPATLPASLTSALVKAGIPASDIGLYVQNLTRDREVLSFGADRAMNPASVMKLVTTFSALEVLGPAYKWKTEAWIDGKMDGDRLVGNLVLKGFGDPKFDLESLWLFLRELRHRGLRVIDGDLLLDRSYFAIDPHDPALFDNEPARPYNVGADALLLNGKSFRLQFVPNEARQTIDIYSEPALPQILVVNRLRVGTGGMRCLAGKACDRGQRDDIFRRFSDGVRREVPLLQPAFIQRLCANPVPSIVGAGWRILGGARAGSDSCTGGQIVGDVGITAVGGPHARGQQAQRQRHGAADSS